MYFYTSTSKPSPKPQANLQANLQTNLSRVLHQTDKLIVDNYSFSVDIMGFMQQKNSPSQIVTKNFLELKLNLLEQKIDDKVEELREGNKQYKDEVLTKLDDISGQLGDMREENIIGVHQTS